MVIRANCFSQTEKNLGQELFNELVTSYKQEDYENFPQWLKENLPDLETRYSFIPDLASLEYVLHSSNVDYQKFNPTSSSPKPLELVEYAKTVDFSLSPNVRVFKSRFPIWEIWEECTKSLDNPNLIHLDLQPKIKSPYYYVLDRDENGPKGYLVKKKTYLFIEGICEGNSFGNIAEKLFSNMEPIVLAKVLSKIHSLSLIKHYHVNQG